jgi:soluble P-type ATPase
MVGIELDVIRAYFEEIKKKAILEWEALQKSNKPTIMVGAATCGRAAGAPPAVLVHPGDVLDEP